MDNSTAKAAQKFLDFLLEDEPQKTFARYGFRPVVETIQLNSISNSPWVENIPGVELNPPVTSVNPPNPQIINEIQRIWNRSS